MSCVPRSSLLVLSIALAGCAAPPAADSAAAPAAIDTSAIRAAIESTEKQWSAAYQKGDGAAVAALYTEDAASIPGAGDWFRGRSAIAADQMKTLDKYDVTSREDVSEEITFLSDGYALEIGHYSWSGKAKKGGAAKSDSGRYVVLWRKDADGTWRIHRDLGTPAVPATP